MTHNLILLESVDKFSINDNNSKIIVFDYLTHKKLDKKNISHSFYDQYLSDDEIKELFDFLHSRHNWNHECSNLEFEGVNILQIISPLEFHETFFPIIKKIYAIKKILEIENPKKVQVSKNLSSIVEQFINKKIIHELSFPLRPTDKGFNSEHIEIRFNLLNKPVSLYISKKLFSKLKSIQENILCRIFNLWYKPDTPKKINLILEFNPALFSSMLNELKNSRNTPVFFNQRRSAVWNWKSIQNLRKNNCKIINPNDFFKLSDTEFTHIKSKFKSNLNNFWKFDEKLSLLFSKENIEFWPEIKKKLIPLYYSRLEDFLKSIIISKNLLDQISINTILSISESGENENIVFQCNKNKNKITTCLLQHSFFRYDPELYDFQWRYEPQSMYGLKSDYYLLWGNADYDFYSQFGIPKEKLIITGSPKHDNYLPINKTGNQKTVLLAIMPITNVSGLCRLQTYIDYELMLEKILQTLKSIENIKIIIKLHPGENFSNTLLNQYFKRKHPDILILQTTPSKKLLEESDILIHTGPEFYEISTIMLEAMLLGNTVIDIYLDENIKNLTPIETGLLRISGNDDFEKIKKIVTNETDSSSILDGISKQLTKYITNQNNSSKYVVKFLDNIEN